MCAISWTCRRPDEGKNVELKLRMTSDARMHTNTHTHLKKLLRNPPTSCYKTVSCHVAVNNKTVLCMQWLSSALGDVQEVHVFPAPLLIPAMPLFSSCSQITGCEHKMTMRICEESKCDSVWTQGEFSYNLRSSDLELGLCNYICPNAVRELWHTGHTSCRSISVRVKGSWCPIIVIKVITGYACTLGQ